MKHIKLLFVILAVIIAGFNSASALENLEAGVKTILALRNLSHEERVDSAMAYLANANDFSKEYLKGCENATNNLLIPYAERHKIDSETCSDLYANLAQAIRGQGAQNFEKAKSAYLRALDYLATSSDYFKLGRLLERMSVWEGNFGDQEESFRLSEEAIKAYEKSDNSQADKFIARCYYQQAYHFLHVYDLDGMKNVVQKMEKFAGNCNSEWKDFALYNLYSVKNAYFGVMEEMGKAQNPKQLHDSIEYYSLKAIQSLEANIDKWQDTSINPVWTYYNKAVEFINYYDYPSVDSVEYYLKKMLSCDYRGRKAMEIEAVISALSLRAEMWQKRGNINKSNDVLNQAVQYIDSLPDNNVLIPDRLEVYKMLSQNAKSVGDYKKALEYSALISKYEKDRYNEEKAKAFKDIETKYEMERKETEIAHLNERNKAASKIMLLMAVILIVILISAGLGVVLMIQRRKIIEQKYYEAALLVEQRDKAISKDFFAAGIEKVLQLLHESRLNEDKKKNDIEKVRNLDPSQLDNIFAAVIPKMTQMDLKYTICFYVAMETADIAIIMNVEPASVYTVKYRLRKKFKDYPVFRFLM